MSLFIWPRWRRRKSQPQADSNSQSPAGRRPGDSQGERKSFRSSGRGVRNGMTSVLLMLAAFLGTLADGGTQPVVAQQAPNTPRRLHKSYLKSNQILLPIVLDPRMRVQLREIQLFVKRQPTQPWTLADKALPMQKEFVYRAPADGEYMFTLITVDRAGRLTADIAHQPPQAIVVVDRKAPEVDVRRLNKSPKGQNVAVKIKDANPDPASLSVEYQTRDMIWRPLRQESGQVETFCVPHQTGWTGMIRVSARDRCGHTTHQEIHLQDGQDRVNVANYNSSMQTSRPQLQNKSTAPANPPAVASQQQKDNGPFLPVVPLPEPESGNTVAKGVTQGNPTKLPGAVGKGANPLPDQPTVAALESVPDLKLPAAPKQKHHSKQEIQQTSVNLPSAGKLVREVVKNARLKLNYRIEKEGASGVGKVEIWVTSDQGQSWQRLAEDPDKKSPASVMLPGEGVYGLSFRATNGLGFGGEPPAPGDRPDWLVEVDSTPPKAKILSIDPTKSTQPGWVLIRWIVSDKNLPEEPIRLEYSSSPSGPWKLVSEKLKNTGYHLWRVPEPVRQQVYVRLSVTDSAGNTAETHTQQPVQVDDNSRPVVRIQGIAQPSSAASKKE